MSAEKILEVLIGRSRIGELAQEGRNKYIFGYASQDTEAVSLTMPVRRQSWASDELHPIFQMNLPEGALLAAVRRAIAKIIGDDDLSILQVTGGSQVGRNRFLLAGQKDHREIQPESLDELLTYPDTKELFHELLNRYALRSGVSGVQPKVLLDATERGTLATTSYIVKTWGADYPQLAANEYFCMTAAKKAGLPTPEFSLADNGGLFIIRRFDQTPDGRFIGFEDMCSLQALGTAQKYRGTYEQVAKSLKGYVSGELLPVARKQFFATLVLSSMIRNGDAHLKNFGVLYPSLTGPIKMAPVFDLVTTTAYLRHDVPALSLAGTKEWWPRKMLERFAVAHLSLPIGEVRRTIERLADAVMETRRLIPGYISEHSEFRNIGESMMDIWEEGVRKF